MRSIALSQKEIDNLNKEVSKKNLKKVPVLNTYELLRVKDRDIIFVVYKTGKMVFQESMGISNFLNSILVRQDNIVIGTDEAGKGEWYGPLVVAAVALTPEEALALRKMGIGDSKRLSSFRIYEIGNILKTSKIEKEVSILSPEPYNIMYEEFKKEGKNLNHILQEMHTQVIYDLLKNLNLQEVTVVIDQFDSSHTVTESGVLREFKANIIQKIGGESEPSVAAASILAKFIFEEEVNQLNHIYDLDLKNVAPEDIPKDRLSSVAKLHFKNVEKAYS
ncbi:MAG: hypothetical protein HXS44_17175 [Theionarchaea archaeon]|nr:hypothetical protein [Theionarchaea archaeon]